MSSLRHQRGDAMIARVLEEARPLVGDADARRVADAARQALQQRESTIEDDHDPRYLHPARTVRILIADAALRDVDALIAGALFESVDTMLAVDVASAAVRAVPCPRPDDEDVLEQLVTADERFAIVALAERLDHARHLHMRRDLSWPDFHASIRADWIPAARRIAPPLARRFEHWADAFERRLLLPRR